MKVSVDMPSNRGVMYRLHFSQMGAEVGGGVLIEMINDKGKAIASTKMPSGEMGSRLLAGWLEAEMPK